ncbi:hypothetical protein M0802_007803 [Mischocyttarus mexicanus]|nr:hypothetical protein M0802_007803 [Mischocyttarus mexicanus]
MHMLLALHAVKFCCLARGSYKNKSSGVYCGCSSSSNSSSSSWANLLPEGATTGVYDAGAKLTILIRR